MFQKKPYLIIARKRAAYWIDPTAPRSAREILNGLLDGHPEWVPVTRDEIELGDPEEVVVLFGYHLEETNQDNQASHAGPDYLGLRQG
jgi:hypothetical protein